MTYFKTWPKKIETRICLQEMSQAEWDRNELLHAADPEAYDINEIKTEETTNIDYEEEVECPF